MANTRTGEDGQDQTQVWLQPNWETLVLVDSVPPRQPEASAS